MLKKVKVSNYYSIGNEIEFEFNSVTSNSYMVMGANGSGKTNVLKALTFIFWFMEHLYNDDDIPYTPHMLQKDKSSLFKIEYVSDGETYKYQFELKAGKLVREELSRKITNRFSSVFRLVIDEKKYFKFSKDLKDLLNKNDIERYKGLSNTSFYGFLKKTGYLKQLGISDSAIICQTNLHKMGRRPNEDPMELTVKLSSVLKDDVDLQSFLIDSLREGDFGIDSFSFDKKNIMDRSGREDEIILTNLIHKSGLIDMKVPLYLESEGTCNIIPILIRLYELIKNGGIMIWDELESSFHPLLAKKFLSKFRKLEQERKNIQLMFTTHMNDLMNSFDKNNIFFVEKNDDLESEIYLLNDVEGVRKDENFALKYLGGAYGAVPSIEGVV